MKKFIVSQSIVMVFVMVVGAGCRTNQVYQYIPFIGSQSQTVLQPTPSAISSGPTFTLTENGKAVPMQMKWVCMKHQNGCACTAKYGNSETLTVTAPSPAATVAAAPTFRWIEQQPVVVQQVVVQPPPVIVQQPIYVEQQVVYDTPRKVYYSTPLISASASIGVSSYGGYYPNTYWQENSRHQEYHNIANTRYNYGMGGGRSYGNHKNYGGGIQPMPPVRYMPGVNGVQLGGGYGGNHGGGHRH
jgi:hypothetical protein